MTHIYTYDPASLLHLRVKLYWQNRFYYDSIYRIQRCCNDFDVNRSWNLFYSIKKNQVSFSHALKREACIDI